MRARAQVQNVNERIRRVCAQVSEADDQVVFEHDIEGLAFQLLDSVCTHLLHDFRIIYGAFLHRILSSLKGVTYLHGLFGESRMK